MNDFLNIQSIKNIGDSWLDSNIDTNNSMITQYTYDRNENGNAILSFNTSSQLHLKFYLDIRRS